MLASTTILLALATSTVATSRGDQTMNVYAPAADRSAGRALVLVLSGEGGWRAFDHQVATWLSAEGYWVGGIDCLKYFWRAQDDRSALASDVLSFARALAKQAGTSADTPVILAGFSFGADLLPWIVGAAGLETHIAALLMIGPDLTGSLEARVTEILGFASKDHTFDTAQALSAARAIPVLLIHGGKDDGSAAPALAERFPGRKILSIVPGANHHFAGHEDELKRAILDGLNRLLSP